MSDKVWFITGASRGFGGIWAKGALARGDKVVATARSVESLSDLAENYGDAVLPLALDVTGRLHFPNPDARGRLRGCNVSAIRRMGVGWLSVTSGVWAMKRLNLTFFLQLGAALGPLVKIPPLDPAGDDKTIEATENFRYDLLEAHRALTALLKDGTIPLAIPASRPAAERLVAHLALIRQKSPLVRQDMWETYWEAGPVKTLLHGELAVQSVYHIWPKRAFDINLLIERATALFSEDVQNWLTDEERYNIDQAGKCVAFETATAAGFHLIRAAESVIRRYYKVVVGVEPALKTRNWGAYIKKLKTCGGDPRVLHALEQIKDLHRNPVIHPEIALTIEEAISLIGITESVVGSIYADMMAREEASRQPSLLLAPTNLLALAARSP